MSDCDNLDFVSRNLAIHNRVRETLQKRSTSPVGQRPPIWRIRQREYLLADGRQEFKSKSFLPVFVPMSRMI